MYLFYRRCLEVAWHISIQGLYQVLASLINIYKSCRSQSFHQQLLYKVTKLSILQLLIIKPRQLIKLQHTAADDPPLWPVVREAIRNSKAYDIIQIKTLPFVNYTVPLTLATCTADDLTNAYNGALEQLNSFVAANKNADLKQVPVSYNMVLTPTYMMLIPRQQERIGPVSCNAVAFAGSFFVRSTDELEYIKSQGPMHVLQQVGYSW